MFRFLIIMTLFFFLSGCHAKNKNYIYYNYNINETGKSGKKEEKDLLASGEIVLTTLFVAMNHIPSIKKISIEFVEKERTSLSKKARQKISDFTEKVLRYEDYEITVEIYTNDAESEEKEKLFDKRSQSIKKALIKSGADKDSINIESIPYLKNNKSGLSTAFIEAEVW